MHPLISSLKSIVENLNDKNSPEVIKVFIKEELQNYVLNFIYNSKNYSDLIFYGGTALRKLYGLNRLSEDLDFEYGGEFAKESFAGELEEYFSKKVGYDVGTSVQSGDLIDRVTVKFPVLYELGLSDYENEKLHVKVEVNTSLSGKYTTEKTPLMLSNYAMVIGHYDLSTMMAGKMLASLDRVYKKGKTGIKVKGRDFYDLIWYMQKRVLPNERKLLDVNPEYSTVHVFELLSAKVEDIRPDDLFIDLRFFFAESEFVRNWCDNFHEFFERFVEFYL